MYKKQNPAHETWCLKYIVQCYPWAQKRFQPQKNKIFIILSGKQSWLHTIKTLDIWWWVHICEHQTVYLGWYGQYHVICFSFPEKNEYQMQMWLDGIQSKELKEPVAGMYRTPGWRSTNDDKSKGYMIRPPEYAFVLNKVLVW